MWKQQSILENIEKMVPQLDAECHTVDDATPRMISTLFTQVLTYLWRGRQLIGTDGKRYREHVRGEILTNRAALKHMLANAPKASVAA